jgi:hypothetical protein
MQQMRMQQQQQQQQQSTSYRAESQSILILKKVMPQYQRPAWPQQQQGPQYGMRPTYPQQGMMPQMGGGYTQMPAQRPYMY